ncbi:hypothetical protein D3H64_02085 [Atopobacter sp. AH10]|uniref:hypothetical protein n=1 Tax=Atopobacter sp. AH10 TaxID=2315861 RepID=UPI000EF236EB|nr:hypothetical protein [Atopobacter sp. AH10]RLK63889.1 hypothetical protein D3H64_02085 [Atopobacter sp. AH10]
MKRIGIIGYNDVMHQLYLPVLSRLEEDIKWYVHEDSPILLNQFLMGLTQVIPCETPEELLQFKLDGVIVARQTQYYKLLKKTLIQRSVPIFTIPPLERDMIQLGQDLQDCLAYGGFILPSYVSRFSEAICSLRDVANKNHIRLSQFFVDSKRTTEELIWTDFAQLLHTTAFILNEPIKKGSFRLAKNGIYLERIIVYLETENQSAIVTVNEQAGTQYQIAEVEGISGVYTLSNWQSMTIRQGSECVVIEKDPWETMPHRYGIETAVQAFIEGLDTKEWPIPAREILETYQICHRIASAISNEGFLTFQLDDGSVSAPW